MDRLADHGFNYTEARLRAGVIAVDHEARPTTESLTPVPKAVRRSPPRGRKQDGSIDRRTLSPRQQLQADGPPTDLPMPYPR